MHSFNIILKQEPSWVLKYLKSEIETNDGVFTGTEDSGTFSGKGIEGSYVCNEDCLTITITKKPFMVPMRLIEKEIRKYFP